MDTEKCAALLCALETGSVSAAAGRRGYTVSGMSRLLASLEEEMGFRLLRRSRAGVRPTPECEELLDTMRELARLGESCARRAAALRGLETGRVRAGISYPAYYDALAGAMAEFAAEHPGVEIELIEERSSALAEMLARGEADFCIMSRRDVDCVWTPLRLDRLAVWIPAGHPLAGCAAFPDRALEDLPYIDILPGGDTDNARFLAERGINARTRFTTTDIYGALSLVSAGLGAALVNELLARGADAAGRAVLLPLSPPHTVEIGAALGREPSLPAARFAEYALPRLLAAGI